MEQIDERVAGLDVHRDSVSACARVPGRPGSAVVDKARFATTTAGLAELAEWLAGRQVTVVGMEATGVYWKAPYYALEKRFEVWLCNAQHVQNVPGRKTDLSDAEWLADVGAHGMVRPSFVPPPLIRELRDLTRYRKRQVDGRAAEFQRLEKVLQDAGIKLLSVASEVLSLSGRHMLEAFDCWPERPDDTGTAGDRPQAQQAPAAERGAKRALWRSSRRRRARDP